MDIPVKYALKGLGFVAWRGLGGRGVYRGLRALHWMDTDRRDPGGAAARNAVWGERDTTRRKWGGIWAEGLAALPPRTLADRWRAGEKFDYMGKKSPQDLREYNRMAVEEGIYKPASDLLEHIRGAGPAGPYARIYARITSQNVAERIESEKKIISMFANIWHRTEQMAWFKRKMDFELKVAKKAEKIHLLKFLIQLQNKILHTGVDTINDVLKKLMKLLGKVC